MFMMDPEAIATNENLFKLQCLIKTTEIRHSVQCKLEGKLFFALATSNTEIILYFKKESSCLPVIKKIPWFQGLHKQIAAFCFDLKGIWLLCVTLDGSLYMLPALTLVSENCIVDERWKNDDATHIPFVNSQLSHFRPQTVIWWEDTKISMDIGIIGTECGAIIFINLLNGQQLGITYINESISSLHICQNEYNEIAFLLITSKFQQWRLPLGYMSFNILHNFENKEPCNELDSNGIIHNMGDSVPNKSKLQELKQLSVEKLAFLKQKLIDTKSQILEENVQYSAASMGENGNKIPVNTEVLKSKLGFVSPEPMSKDTFLFLQYDREDRQLYTCYHPVTNYITVHGPDLTMVPLSMHKVIESCETVLLAHRLFFITDVNQHAIYIISDQLSETHTNEDYQFNPESIIGMFSFKNDKEIIRAIYKVTKFDNIPRKVSEDLESKYTLPKHVRDIKIEPFTLDTCIIVTNRCVYEVVLRKSLLSIFMELVLKKNELQKAGKLAIVFGLNGQRLLEYVGDIFLSNKEFSRAVASYKMSKCKLLKSVLKFASVGHTSELLICLTHCLLTPVITQMPVATRIHLSNLCVLSFIETALRIWSEQSKAIYKEFLYFLSTNTFYDELLAINIAGQTYLWEVLHHLATQRSLYGQMLDILVKAIQIFDINDIYPKSYGLLICLSESDLLQSMLLNYDLAKSHMLFVRNNLRNFQIFVLQRLVTLYNPTNPVLRPKLIQCKARHKMISWNPRFNRCDSTDSTDNIDQLGTLVEEIIETFISVLLTLIHKKRLLNPNSKHTFLYDVQLPEVNKEYLEMTLHVDFKRRPLSTGFSHVALVRNGNIYTWGSSVQGCLGTGSSVLRYGAPHAICFFKNMKIEVFSVSCGHCHTLVVTNNGIYAWGANQFGQLGLGKVLQCSNPELVTSLAQEIIVDAVAGQYHSVALTADGRIFTWGWGVHGQLGHGNIDEKITPSLVKALLGTVVCYISAGYAHTLALSVDGVVYAFGCNVLGQLGRGDNAKSSIPIKVALPDRIILISTGYFHNLAVTNANKLYTWGASPQVLRLQAQAQKKTRILEQRNANEKKSKGESEKVSSSATNLNEGIKEEFLVNDIQTEFAQTKAITSDTEAQKRPETENDLKNLRDCNFSLIDEDQAHLKPCVVDTSLVKGQINQISAGCHHNALITADGSLYTWGRNLDGQIGNGTRREVPIPTPLCYNSASIFAQIPPRHNYFKRMQNQWDLDIGAKSNDSMANNGNMLENNGNEISLVHTGNIGNKEGINPIINAVGIACGYDYTVAIQPEGTVLAWGNNSRAQLGRIPAKETRDVDDKLVLLKSSKRIVRLPNALHIALDVPSQVPGISTPVISYRSNDAFSLAGFIHPLSIIERSPGELTLHYILEHFYGLYNSTDIMKKCIELENYQACSKIAALENNVLAAFTYQLKILHKLNLQSFRNYPISEKEIPHDSPRIESTIETSTLNVDVTRDSMPSRDIKRNTELFNRQAEKNLMESLETSVTRSWMKISTSRSLNNLQILAQELYSFDCQGGLEELCRTRKDDDSSPNVNIDNPDIEYNTNINKDEQQGWIENLIFNENTDSLHKNVTLRNSARNSTRSVYTKTMATVNDNRCDMNEKKTVFSDKLLSHLQRNYIINETLRALKFYLKNIDNEANTVKYKILQSAINFWMMHNLPMQSLENVFLEHMHIVCYPLGLLLFCQDATGKYLNISSPYDDERKNWCANNLFSVRFCLQVLSMLMQRIAEGNIMPEYIKIFSSLMADNYGAPLNGYPGTSRNNNPEQMMKGIVSTVLSQMEDFALFAHIKDSNAISHLLTIEEDNMIFTCGHHFSISLYEADIIPTMETELLTSPSLTLPCTSQYLGDMLSLTFKPEILCPLCIIGALRTTTIKNCD